MVELVFQTDLLIKQSDFLTPSLLSTSFFRKKTLLQNASNLTHEIFYDNFNKEHQLKFFVEIVIQKLICHIWFIFKEKWLIFSSKSRCWEVKVLIYLQRAVLTIFRAINKLLCYGVGSMTNYMPYQILYCKLMIIII